VVHPELADIAGVYGTIITSTPMHPGSTQSNACIFADRELDRSPTGSGTAGRIAQLHARRQFAIGDVLVNESIIGSVFTGRILAETQLGGRVAIVPEIQGEAYICGFGQWVIDERDPLTHGFQLRYESQTSQ
jgi:trans-L-3-hydroxyproline dehydratase